MKIKTTKTLTLDEKCLLEILGLKEKVTFISFSDRSVMITWEEEEEDAKLPIIQSKGETNDLSKK